jgi:hypothetical protein
MTDTAETGSVSARLRRCSPRLPTRSERWSSSSLTPGFEKRAYFPYGGGRWIEVGLPRSATAIALVPPSEGQSAGSDEAHCARTTEDIEADRASLRASRVVVDAEIARTSKPRSGLVSIEATVADSALAEFCFRDTEGSGFLIVQPD